MWSTVFLLAAFIGGLDCHWNPADRVATNKFAAPDHSEDEGKYAQYQLMCQQGQKLSDPEFTCCGNKVFHNSTGQECCCDQIIDTKQRMCCSGTIQERVDRFSGCCGKQVFNMNTHHCCAGRIIERLRSDSACCGANAYDFRHQLCCSGRIIERSSGKSCCGNVAYNVEDATCCGKTLHPTKTAGVEAKRVAGSPAVGALSVMPRRPAVVQAKCCGEEILVSGRECCGAKLLNPLTHVCKTENGRSTRVPIPSELRGKTVRFCNGKLYDVHGFSCEKGRLRRFPSRLAVSLCVKTFKKEKNKLQKSNRCCQNLDALRALLAENQSEGYVVARKCGVQRCGNQVKGKNRSGYTSCCNKANDWYHFRREMCCGDQVINKDRYTCQYDNVHKQQVIKPKPADGRAYCGQQGSLTYDQKKERCCSPGFPNVNQNDHHHCYGSDITYQQQIYRQPDYRPWLQSSYPSFVLPIPANATHYNHYHCCGSQLRHYNDVCCGHKIFKKEKNRNCCGNVWYDTTEQVCCDTNLFAKYVSGVETRCCGREAMNSGERCVGGVRYAKSRKRPLTREKPGWNSKPKWRRG